MSHMYNLKYVAPNEAFLVWLEYWKCYKDFYLYVYKQNLFNLIFKIAWSNRI